MGVSMRGALVLAVALLTPTAFAADRNPLGEVADYELDRVSRRTSSIITDGDLVGTVTAFLPDDADGPVYETTIDWEIKIQLIGKQSGRSVFKVPTVYFTPAFLEQLRRDGTYHGPEFSLRHEGYADARNKDGAFYPNCDLVRMYDIQDEGAIDDLEILSHVVYGVPVLGAVKMDMTGKYQGQRVKIGADYETP